MPQETGQHVGRDSGMVFGEFALCHMPRIGNNPLGCVIVIPSSTRPFAEDFADGAAAGTLFTGWGFSIFTSAAFLSSLKPWNEGCRIWPSSVHSVKVTSHSKTGFTP